MIQKVVCKGCDAVVFFAFWNGRKMVFDSAGDFFPNGFEPMGPKAIEVRDDEHLRASPSDIGVRYIKRPEFEQLLYRPHKCKKTK